MDSPFGLRNERFKSLNRRINFTRLRSLCQENRGKKLQEFGRIFSECSAAIVGRLGFSLCENLPFLPRFAKLAPAKIVRGKIPVASNRRRGAAASRAENEVCTLRFRCRLCGICFSISALGEFPKRVSALFGLFFFPYSFCRRKKNMAVGDICSNSNRLQDKPLRRAKGSYAAGMFPRCVCKGGSTCPPAQILS